MDFERELVRINSAFADKGIKLRVEQRGAKLNLRGPLPNKSNSSLISIQRVSLGINSDSKGLIEAEKTGELINFQLEQNQFKWENWLRTNIHQTSHIKEEINEQLKNFEDKFFSNPYRRLSPSGTRTTWSSSYLPYLRRLQLLKRSNKGNLNKELFLSALKSYKENSRSRKQCGTALRAFAEHINLDLPEDWNAQANGYGIHKANFRKLPSDNLIEKIWETIPNKKWKNAYAIMATYGLRNHEIFYSDLSSLVSNGDRVIRVLPTTKTGEHQVWPFNPEWVNLFSLGEIGDISDALPKINLNLNETTLQQVGRRVAEQFKRYKIPFTPYDLRHAWAIRTIHIGLPDTVAARMMGHSVDIHTRTYHHWITRRDQQQAVDKALSNR
tara:strand:+ start:2078 stop:3229 length:1152 start_codon:yes stop_codon:yes gene_type:complete